MTNKMTIKESGRYANFLNEMIQEVQYLSAYGMDSKLKTITEVHKRSEANKEATDREVVVEFDDKIDIEIEMLNTVVDKLVLQKIDLAEAIAKAKKSIQIKANDRALSLDTAIEYAKLLRTISDNYYGNFIDLKESRKESKASDYTFNIEGNQITYWYEVETEVKLKFDKKMFIDKVKNTKSLADKISESIERSMISEIVEFEPEFSYLDSLEDVINKVKYDIDDIEKK